MSFPSIIPGSEKIMFKTENENRAVFNSPFSPIKDLCMGTYRTIMGVWTLANFKIFYPGVPLMEQKPRIQGFCEMAAFYCGLNPTYPHITELNIPGSPFFWEIKKVPCTHRKIALPMPQFPVITVHMTTGASLNKACLQGHRNGSFDGGSMSYDAAFKLLQAIFPETQFSKEDFLLTCGEEFTGLAHKQIIRSLKGEHLDSIIESEGTKLMDRWREYSEKDEAFDLAKEMRHLTSAIITEAVFGNSTRHRELSDAVNFMNIYLVKQVLGGFSQEDKKNFLQSCQIFAEIINDIIQDENSNFFPIFQKEFTLAQKQGLCLLMFFAGQETTAFALTHNLAELALNPMLQKELCEAKDEDLNRFINRQLVKLPPVDGIARKLKVDTYIEFENENGKTVGKLTRRGERITANFADTAKNALENMANPTYKDANIFGEGGNQCIGKHLALRELRKITASAISMFELITEESEFNYQTLATKQAEAFFVKAKLKGEI